MLAGPPRDEAPNGAETSVAVQNWQGCTARSCPFRKTSFALRLGLPPPQPSSPTRGKEHTSNMAPTEHVAPIEP
jgi:hypothetical protein